MRRLLALTEAVYGGKHVLQQQHQPGCSCQAQPLHLHRVLMRSCKQNGDVLFNCRVLHLYAKQPGRNGVSISAARAANSMLRRTRSTLLRALRLEHPPSK